MTIDLSKAAIYAFPMVSRRVSATEEIGSVPVAADEVAATAAKEPSRQFLRSARRDLSDDELATPAARRFLIAELERLDEENSELRLIEREYHNQREVVATLRADVKTSKWTEILSFVCLSVGSAGIGAAPSYLTIKDGFAIGIMILGFAIILVLVGVASKVFR